MPVSWLLWARIPDCCVGSQDVQGWVSLRWKRSKGMYDGSCDLGLAGENPEASPPWPHGLGLAHPPARATPLFLQSLLIRDTLLTITAACAKSESRAVRVLIVLVCTSLPCCPACPASCGPSQLSLGGIRHFPVQPVLRPHCWG